MVLMFGYWFVVWFVLLLRFSCCFVCCRCRWCVSVWVLIIAGVWLVGALVFGVSACGCCFDLVVCYVWLFVFVAYCLIVLDTYFEL